MWQKLQVKVDKLLATRHQAGKIHPGRRRIDHSVTRGPRQPLVGDRKPLTEANRQRDQELLEHASEEAVDADGDRPRDAHYHEQWWWWRRRDTPRAALGAAHVHTPHAPHAVGAHSRGDSGPSELSDQRSIINSASELALSQVLGAETGAPRLERGAQPPARTRGRGHRESALANQHPAGSRVLGLQQRVRQDNCGLASEPAAPSQRQCHLAGSHRRVAE